MVYHYFKYRFCLLYVTLFRFHINNFMYRVLIKYCERDEFFYMVTSQWFPKRNITRIRLYDHIVHALIPCVRVLTRAKNFGVRIGLFLCSEFMKITSKIIQINWNGGLRNINIAKSYPSKTSNLGIRIFTGLICFPSLVSNLTVTI